MNKNIIILIAIILLGLLIFEIYFLRGKYSTGEVIFKRQNISITVEIASNSLTQMQGLMGRKELPEYSGMLFVFRTEAPRTFWMKNTHIPLDLIFISHDKKIKEIKANFEPCIDSNNCPSYQSKENAQYVLEVNGGFCERHQIEVGDEIELKF